jgi:hypothetical protein
MKKSFSEENYKTTAARKRQAIAMKSRLARITTTRSHRSCIWRVSVGTSFERAACLSRTLMGFEYTV